MGNLRKRCCRNDGESLESQLGDSREPSPCCRKSHWAGQGQTLTLRGLGRLLAFLLGVPEAHGNVQKLLIAVSVPHEQLLVLVDVFTALVEYLPVALHGCQVLLLGESSTVDIGHPVPRTVAVDEMAQATVFKNLNKMRQEVYFARAHVCACVYFVLDRIFPCT